MEYFFSQLHFDEAETSVSKKPEMFANISAIAFDFLELSGD